MWVCWDGVEAGGGWRYHEKEYKGLCWWSWGFPDSSVGKESACNMGDLGSITELGRSPGEGNGHSLQCQTQLDD